ncbi:MAG: hypothetical protein IJO85_07465 [Lachnospiraceae bacterium]|nr:hypothetical protein [Lachnospiraceae bacterium]
MRIWNMIRSWISRMFTRDVEREFKVESIESDIMSAAIKEWSEIYQGKPPWADDDIESFNFAKKICNETARLTTLDLKINVEGSVRAEWLQALADSFIVKMQQEEFEKACAFGHIIIKPNGSGIDYIMPWEYVPVDTDVDGNITAAIFFDRYHDEDGKWYYTRMEYHRFEELESVGETVYAITNKIYRSAGKDGLGLPIMLKDTKWSWMQEEEYIANIEKPLFAVLKMPVANNVDINSPLGCSIFANAEKELKNLDIAHTRLGDEIFDSQKKIFMGDMLTVGEGKPVKGRTSPNGAVDKIGKKLPRYVHILPGTETGEEYHEINPQLQTDERIKGINHFLNLVGVKCGYSTGQFVLDGRTGHVTATQVEADDRETIQLIKQIRDVFQKATDNMLYAANAIADIYNITPVGAYEVKYAFGDITYNWEEDRARHWGYVIQGKYPLWRYYVKFEGMSEEEAKEIVAEAQGESAEKSGLFEEE